MPEDRCNFEWEDGWGKHKCMLRGKHERHFCACDATRMAEIRNAKESGE